MNSIEKFRKNSKTLINITKAGKIFSIAIVVLLFGTALFIAFGGNYTQFGAEISANGLRLDIARATRGQMLGVLITAGLYGLGLLLLFILLHRLLIAMVQGESPFNQKVTQHILQISYYLAGFCAGKFVLQALIGYFIAGRMPFVLDAGLLLAAFIVYCLAQLFDYGCQLQQQADETL